MGQHRLQRRNGIALDVRLADVLRDELPASDVVVAPSQGPELGRPVIEAAASGVPVVDVNTGCEPATPAGRAAASLRAIPAESGIVPTAVSVLSFFRSPR